ncbi:hypothetical protein [Komagataeibacter europaeus]|uniref:hypothetical protein n=1 Tax=Komagataeibacter europaeus TaxID=33995 RepID=UPI0011DD02E1|nr:hypothetical protein [Komagataeibacter europaeus]
MSGFLMQRIALRFKMAAAFRKKKRLPPGFYYVTQTAGGVSVTYAAPIRDFFSTDQSATGEVRFAAGQGSQSGTGQKLPSRAWGRSDFHQALLSRMGRRAIPPQEKVPEQPQRSARYFGGDGTDACCAQKGSIKEKAFWLSMVLLTLAMVTGTVRVWQFAGRTAYFRQVV